MAWPYDFTDEENQMTRIARPPAVAPPMDELTASLFMSPAESGRTAISTAAPSPASSLWQNPRPAEPGSKTPYIWAPSLGIEGTLPAAGREALFAGMGRGVQGRTAGAAPVATAARPAARILTPDQRARQDVVRDMSPARRLGYLSGMNKTAPENIEAAQRERGLAAQYQAEEDAKANREQRIAERVAPAEIRAQTQLAVEDKRTGRALDVAQLKHDTAILVQQNKGTQASELAAQKFGYDQTLGDQESNNRINEKFVQGDIEGGLAEVENAAKLQQIEKQYTMQGANQKQAQSAALTQVMERTKLELENALTLEDAKSAGRRLNYLTAQSLEREGKAAEPFKTALDAEKAKTAAGEEKFRPGRYQGKPIEPREEWSKLRAADEVYKANPPKKTDGTIDYFKMDQLAARIKELKKHLNL